MKNVKQFMVGLLALFIITNCGGAPTDKEIKGAFEGFKGSYKGLVKVLTENKANPSKGIEEAKKFIEANKDKIKGYGKILSKAKESQIHIIESSFSGIQKEFAEEGRKLGASYSGHIGDVKGLVETINSHLLSSQPSGSSSANKSAKENARKMAKEQILKQADAFKATPATGRDQVLNSLTQSLKQLGADQAEIDAFKKELKEKLGW